MTRAIVALVLAWSATLSVLVSSGGVAEAAPDTTGEVQPIHLVIAVDESGSLSESDIGQERIAAASIAMSELSPQSDVTVFGFGSNTGGVPAVDGRRICSLKPGAAAQDREAVGNCVEQNIARRERGKGDNTDFVAALNQGLDALTRPPRDDRPRLLLLLTDGRLDVRGDRNYGEDEASQQRYAQEQLEKLVVPKAHGAGVQIWPIGFGSDIDFEMLKFLASNGGLTGCEDHQAAPVAKRAADATAAVAAMMDAFVQARCLDQNRSPQRPLGDGGQVDLQVSVPAIATDGAINVVKGDPRVKVAYLDPTGKQAPAVGTVDDTTYELAGTSGVVESMRIRNPRPGTWHVRLTAPADLTDRMVSATAIWQGVLRTVFVLDPPSPQPGEKFAVLMRPQTRSAEITDPAALRGLSFSAVLSGPGVDAGVARLADDGTAPDARAADAYYSAYFTLPADAKGTYQVVGRATGPGVTSDQRVQTFQVGPGGPQVRVKVVLDGAEGLPGAEITGRLLSTNETTQPRPVRLKLDGPGHDAVSLASTGATLPPGSGSTAFTIRIADNAAAGAVGGVIQVVDAGTGTVLGNAPLDVKVLPKPTVWDKWPWMLAGFLLLTAVGVLIWQVRRRRVRAADLRDVELTLFEDGAPLRPVLKLPPGDRFAFDIRIPDDGTPPSLQRVAPGSHRFTIERADGGFRVDLPDDMTTPDRPVLKLASGETVPLPEHPRLALNARNPDAPVPEQATGDWPGDEEYEPATSSSYHDDDDL
ncbi:choice-of-anchor X domain-containing protein [Actinoplanes subtropicus]|uniref:choice-of-anchor X domain-containing protein n=1 Tax=Actinoplanes subtropicus TaxID=543632 RepID=UPI0004C36E2A|nr:choice-of-anchor X domain-containing protein [Actinoplanes subtropicus]